ncbi:serine protease [Sesbania bispinosa]|nr:serine protease [Sesbania bispinosa]
MKPQAQTMPISSQGVSNMITLSDSMRNTKTREIPTQLLNKRDHGLARMTNWTITLNHINHRLGVTLNPNEIMSLLGRILSALITPPKAQPSR